MCVCTYVCLCTYIYAHTHTYIHTHVYAFTLIFLRTHTLSSLWQGRSPAHTLSLSLCMHAVPNFANEPGCSHTTAPSTATPKRNAHTYCTRLQCASKTINTTDGHSDVPRSAVRGKRRGKGFGGAMGRRQKAMVRATRCK